MSNTKHDQSKPVAKAATAAAIPLSTSFSQGSFIEFVEKNGRMHIGKILSVEHKVNGKARYTVVDDSGQTFSIPDKAVHYSMVAPTAPSEADRLFHDLAQAQQKNEEDLRHELDVTPDLLELLWEECLEEHTNLTPKTFIELMHHADAPPPRAIDLYMAWRLLKADMAHIFFNELKQNGRVVAFKARARKAVLAARKTFCRNPEHFQEFEFCLI